MLPTFSIKAEDVVKKYTNRHSFKNTLGIQADIQEEIIKLLKVWIPTSKIGKKKILLIVEDIDRCSEDKILQNIDALRIMLDDEKLKDKLLVITAIDERILQLAVALVLGLGSSCLLLQSAVAVVLVLGLSRERKEKEKPWSEWSRRFFSVLVKPVLFPLRRADRS